MQDRLATAEDCPTLAELKFQLIHDEGHRNLMTLAQLEERMRSWLTSGEYWAVLFEENHEVGAYALFRETDAEVYLRQFFVVPQRRGALPKKSVLRPISCRFNALNTAIFVSILTFWAKPRRGEGIGRRAMGELFSKLWSRHKRLTVSVLVKNVAGVAFWRAMGYTDYEWKSSCRKAASPLIMRLSTGGW
jgi:GNAT superfamily N-acetyltransferase